MMTFGFRLKISLKGPIVKRSSYGWMVIPLGMYFHMLPYMEALLDWISRQKDNTSILHSGTKNCALDPKHSVSLFSDRYLSHRILRHFDYSTVSSYIYTSESHRSVNQRIMEMNAPVHEVVASKEVVVKELLDILVEPHLPLCYIPAGYPSIDKQQSVAKQLHGVVLLYNYYHRKQYTQAEYMDFKSFRELVVTLKPFLEFHMNCKSQSDSAELDDSENQLTIAEKAIQDACNLSIILDASKANPVIEEWEISKVSVLFVDSKKENCFLMFGSVNDGVWSLLEKDFEKSTTHSKLKERKRTNKTNDSHLQRLAFLAVMDATGIRQSDLVVLEKHVVYSLSKAKTTACFYIIQCTGPTKLDFQNPIEYIINSLQGPLVENSSGAWFTTPVVEYFHLLPYATIISAWFSGSTNYAKSSGKEVGASASSQRIGKEKTMDERESSRGHTKDATAVEVIEVSSGSDSQ